MDAPEKSCLVEGLTLELQLSLCTKASEVGRILQETTASVQLVLSLVPECVDGTALGHLLNTQYKLTDELAELFVTRAEAIDERTGRVDNALAWLNSLHIHSPLIARAQRNAKMLDQALMAGQQVPILREINRMDDDAIVEWVAGFGTEAAEVFPNSDSELHAAWNAWWTRNMMGAEMAEVVQQCSSWFDDAVLVAAVFAVGAPCSEYPAAVQTLEVLAERHGIKEKGSVELEDSALNVVNESTVPGIIDRLQNIDISALIAPGMALAHAVKLLGKLGHGTDIASLVGCQGNIRAQQRLLTQCTIYAQHEPFALHTLQSLCDLGLFGCLPADAAALTLLRGHLRRSQFEAARVLLDNDPPIADEAAVRDAIREAAQELFDNAETGCRDVGLLRDATQCLDLLTPMWKNDAGVRRERLLIDAAHLVWTLAPSGGSEPVLPIEIRLGSDPIALLRLVLSRSPGSYRKQRVVRELGAVLLTLSGDGNATASSDLQVHSASDALVVVVVLEAALAAEDYQFAYRATRLLIGARNVLSNCMAAVEESRARKFLLLKDNEVDLRMEVRAAEDAWRAAAQLAQRWSSGATSERQEVVSLALRLCPAAEIPALLLLWDCLQGTDGATPTVSTETQLHDLLIGQEPTASVEKVDPDTMHTFDSAILRRALQTAGPSSVDGQWSQLLIEWLVFSLTTDAQPTTPAAQRLCKRMEAEIVRTLAPNALAALRTRVLKQLDQRSFVRMQDFYAFYARCSTEEKSQAQVRAELAQRLAESPVSLTNLGFDQWVRLALAPATEPLPRPLPPAHVPSLLALSPLLARICVLPEVDTPGIQATAPESTELCSTLCLRLLLDSIREGDVEVLSLLLDDCVQNSTAKDLVLVAGTVAFDAEARNLPLGARRECADRCYKALSSANPGVQSQLNAACQFLGFLDELELLCDPYTPTPLSPQWVARFDSIASAGSEFCQQCFSLLEAMVVDGESTSVVCQTYIYARELLAQNGVEWTLGDVYASTLKNSMDTIDVIDMCERTLELCTTSHDDDAFRRVLDSLQDGLGKEMQNVIEDSGRDSNTRLGLLGVYDRYLQKQRPITDTGALRLRLLADKHWGIDDLGSQDSLTDLEARLACWRRLLAETPVKDCMAKLEALGKLLLEWAEETEDDAVETCLVQWLVRAIECECPELVLVAIGAACTRFTHAVGVRLFEAMEERAYEEPRLVQSLALVALAFPDQQWAEPCMGLVIHTMLSSEDIQDEPKREDEEDEDPWAIDDALQEETSVDNSEILHARQTILNSAELHIAIVARGYIAACVACPALLDALRYSLLRAALCSDGSRVLLDMSGGRDVLLCRALHALVDAGAELSALAWIYEFLDVPQFCRFAADVETVWQWLRHVDAVLGPAAAAAAADKESIAIGSIEEKSATRNIEEEAADAESTDAASGWEDDDLDLDADLENL
ncbi:hypothetical protein COEREDRAFT_87523 [Coemansia reversa NRRL 1564]|uniref:Sec39 domain-containing protein n=1 Tax=Coemansia reversa (strain ATCC 12441 / NRRL 1564) TaxID=763665 RepID=A0A2G5B9T5_COERN|nr:hypothetical protein COEREDRAFT_87523 [Coemansia reversa NRRL 1564]|eukprot:PIA15773.1 hypothetical protein COEREDRAFT_87523 [Coemansia reversa NRRL 1564]